MYIIFGILISVPLFIFSVFLFRYFGKKYPDLVVPYEIDRSKYSEGQLKVLDRIQEKQSRNEDLATEDFADLLAAEKLPSAFLSFATLLVPIVLIFANTLVGQIGALQGTAFAECGNSSDSRLWRCLFPSAWAHSFCVRNMTARPVWI